MQGHAAVLERLHALDAEGVLLPEPRKQTKQQRQKKEAEQRGGGAPTPAPTDAAVPAAGDGG